MVRPVVAVLAAALVAGCGATRFPAHPSHDLHPRFHRFALFHAGARVAGLALTEDATADLRTYYAGRPVTFGYGFCHPRDDGEGGASCALPVEVENFPACAENVAKYTDGVRPRRFVTVRGTRVAVFADKVLVTTGVTTVEIYANDPATALRVVRALRSTDGRTGPGERLPPPRDATALCG